MNMRRLFLLSLLFLLAACHGEPGWRQAVPDMIRVGELARADSLLGTLRDGLSPQEARAADSLREMIRRLRIEFRYTLPEIARQVRRRISDTVSDSQIERWTEEGRLEMRTIDGEPRYFARAAANLVRLAPELAAWRPSDSASQRFRAAHAGRVIRETGSFGVCASPVPVTIRYTLSVRPDAVPDGDTLRCWLPYPQQGLDRQTDVELLGCSPAQHAIAPEGTPQRSIYMEQAAVRGRPAVFTATYRTTCRARYFDPEQAAARALPYDTASERYRVWTAERPPHIVFSRRLKETVREAAGSETNPVRVAARICDWIEARFPWAGSIEYGVIPNIPEYVLEAGHGDCGQVSLLMIAMLRCAGIPARWESGWALHPGEVGMHDWASVYYEGIGWVPVDMSFGTIRAGDDEAVRRFYRSGIDSYRLVVNTDYGRPLVPVKRHIRSEPVDFQRGEVETARRNLYFDEWDYAIDVSYE